MIFLIEYNRPQGRIVTFKTFDDRERFAAEDERLAIELALNRQGQGLEQEVVVLQAESEQAVRRTHRRYFETIRELISPPAA